MSSSMSFEEFDFSGAMRDLSQGLLVQPILQNYLFDAKFPAFDLHFPEQQMERAPDNWYHPSTHPLVHEKVLYQYLAHPETFPIERKKHMSTLAVTMGKVSHEFVQMCLTDAGVRPEALQVCTMCPPEVNCHEAGVMDAEIGERGHMDGVLDFTGFPNVPEDKMQPVLEFKCLAPETMVSMADGSLLSADSISSGDMVLGWDETQEICVPSRVSAAWDNGIHPVWLVTTKEGRSIGVTSEHPFLTSRGWVLARDLRPKDKVRVGWGSDWATDTAETEEPYFLGAMTGDGSLTGNSISITNGKPEVVSRIRDYVESQGATLRHVVKTTYNITVGRKGRGQNPVREILRREGMTGTSSYTKRIPPSVWRGGPTAWISYLSGYFDTDGTVVTKGSYPHLHWASVNKPLLLECQILLGYLGIRSSVVLINGKYKGDRHVSYRLQIRDRRAVLRAQRTLRLVSFKRQLLAEMVFDPTTPTGKTRRDAEFQQGWDEVIAVHEGVARPTIAIEVEGGNHITDGLVTHNTSHDEFGRLSKVPNMDVEAFKKKWPTYWAQTQRYMRLSRRPWTIVLMMEMVYPFVMREFHVAFDPGFNAQIDAKYRAVRQAVADQRPPLCCGQKGCITALACGVLR